MDSPVPVVPIADDPDGAGVGSPHRERCAGDTLVDDRMRSKHLPQPAVPPFAEEGYGSVPAATPEDVEATVASARAAWWTPR